MQHKLLTETNIAIFIEGVPHGSNLAAQIFSVFVWKLIHSNCKFNCYVSSKNIAHKHFSVKKMIRVGSA